MLIVALRKKIKFLIYITIASIIMFITFSYLFGKILSKDISIEPINYNINSDLRPSVYLISYADGHEVFFKNQNTLANSAINKGIDFILNYRRAHLDQKFVKQHASILTQKKGAGFWLWKPYVILKTLETIKENDIVIYSDTGLLFREQITPLIKLTKQHDVILFEYDPKEYYGKPIHTAKREILIELDCDTNKCHYGQHVWAGVLLLKNTNKSREFIKKWLKYSCKEEFLTDQLDPKIQQHPEFVAPSHDEAILNILYNKDPTGKYLVPSKLLFDKYATWHHRDFKTQDYSLLMATRNNRSSIAYIIENDLLNNYLIIFFRKMYQKIFCCN
ncbi:MAG: hypothetical protein ABSA84_03865 [Gammaproteobacteria bacterium]|jgi:hypothetical protein